jgi:hypothetical protein
MGGQAGGRGYLLQSLICLLELARDRSHWDTLTLEPDLNSEKVDLCVTAGGQVTVCQIKSSQNLISLPDVQNWAAELEASISADRYELRLIGPCSDSVCKAGHSGKVQIPTPYPLNIKALIEQAAHQLDAYFETRGISRVPPFAREILVNALVTKLSTWATDGRPINHADLDVMFTDWVLELYPQSISQAVEMQCSVLWDLVTFPVAGEDLSSLLFIAPLGFRNDGVRTVIVEDLVVVISTNGLSAQFGATISVDLAKMQREGMRFDMTANQGFFMEFAVPPGETLKMDLVFVPTHDPVRSDRIAAIAGLYDYKLYGLFADRQEPVLLKSKVLQMNADLGPMFKSYGPRGAFVVTRFKKRAFVL